MITAGELKNWGYCPRVVFYRRRMAVSAGGTYKMDAGLAAQEMIERFEARRALDKYGFEGGTRRRNWWLVDDELGLNGRLDYVLENEAEAAVVDFKLTAGEPGRNHKLQLAGYALLVERRLAKRVGRCFIYRIPTAEFLRLRSTRRCGSPAWWRLSRFGVCSICRARQT